MTNFEDPYAKDPYGSGPPAYPPPGGMPYGPPGPQPYGPPPYGPPPYGPAPYGPPFGGSPYGPAPFGVDHPEGTTVLLLGILGLVLCSVLGPIAWVKGRRVLREIDASPGRYSNRGAVMAGYVCGIVASVFLILAVAVIVIAIVAVAVTANS